MKKHNVTLTFNHCFQGNGKDYQMESIKHAPCLQNIVPILERWHFQEDFNREINRLKMQKCMIRMAILNQPLCNATIFQLCLLLC